MFAAAFAASAFAVDFTVAPAQGWQPEIDSKIVVSFMSPVEVVNDGATSVSYNIGAANETLGCTSGMELQADGNDLIIRFTRADTWVLKPGLAKPFRSMSTMSGGKTMGDPCDMEFTVPAGSYKVDGVDGEEIKLSYTLSTEKPAVSFDYTVLPEEGKQAQIEKQVVISFTSPVAIAKDGAASVSYNIGAANETLDCTSGMELLADGNNLIINFTRGENWVLYPGLAKPFRSMSTMSGGKTMGDPCDMEFTVPAGAYTVGGEEGIELKLNYTLATPAPEVSFDFTANPAEGWLQEATKTFVLTFEGAVEMVEANTSATFVTVNGPSSKDGVSTAADGNTITITTRQPLAIGKSGTFATVTPALAEGPVVFTLPEGSYTVDGQAGPEIVLNYLLSADDPNAPKTTITPAPDSHNASMKEVVINFGGSTVPEWTTSSLSNGAVYWNSLTNGAYTSIGSKIALSVRDNSLVMAMPNDGLAPGKYEFSFSAYKVDGVAGEELKFDIYVDAPDLENAQAFEFTVDPTTKAVQKVLKTLTFTLPGEVVLVNPFNGNCQYSFESAEAAAAPTNKSWFANDWTFGGCYAEGNKLVLANSASSGLSIPDSADCVYFCIPGGTFTVDGVYNQPINLKYYVKSPDFFDFDSEPVSGDVVEVLDNISLEFFDVDTDEMTFEAAEETNVQILRNGVAVEDVTVSVATEDNFLNLTVEPAQNMPGQYQVVIPAGTFFIEGFGNAETTLKYSIDYATAEFTADPADGSEMTSFQKVVLTFGEEDEIGVTPEATYVNLSGGNWDATYTAEANVLTIELDRPRYAYEDENGNVHYLGDFTCTIKDGFYTINGVPGAKIELNYNINELSTGVEGIAADNVKVTIYDAQGRALKSAEGLKGIFIVNGKKQILK